MLGLGEKNDHFDVLRFGNGPLFQNDTLKEVSYDDGKMEAGLGDNSLETIQGARGVRTAF